MGHQKCVGEFAWENVPENGFGGVAEFFVPPFCQWDFQRGLVLVVRRCDREWNIARWAI